MVHAVTRRQIDADTRRALAAIYLAAYGDSSLPESRLDADNFVASPSRRHSRRAGFRLVGATTDGQTSGYAYGFTGMARPILERKG